MAIHNNNNNNNSNGNQKRSTTTTTTTAITREAQLQQLQPKTILARKKRGPCQFVCLFFFFFWNLFLHSKPFLLISWVMSKKQREMSEKDRVMSEGDERG